MSDKIEYPQFRKYPNGSAFFKITSSQEWEEILIIGSKLQFHNFKVKILPDRNYLHDLTFDYKKNWVKIEKQEYEIIKKKL